MDTLRILHLEDNALDAELALNYLKRDFGALDVHWVINRHDFVTALSDDDFHIILADHQLPDFDGITALRVARELRPEIPFIFVSGTLGEDVAIDALKRGATDYVTKTKLERLATAVHRAFVESQEREKRLQAEADLHEGRELFQRIVESASDYAIFTLDLVGCISSWNLGAERMLGFTDAEVISKDFGLIFTREDCEAQVPLMEIEKALREGRVADERWHQRKDGSRFWGIGSTMVLRNSRGEIRGFLKILRDHTFAKRTEETLAERDRRKDEFLAMLAHELRNPLAPIRNSVELLKLVEGSDLRVAYARDVVERQVQQLTRLVDDLLDASRITLGKVTLKKQRVSLATVVMQAVETMRPSMEAKQHQFALTLYPEPLHVLVDVTRMAQVIGNLLSNAAKYTDQGGHIELGIQKNADDCATIYVRDSGIGISAELLPQVFELFTQGDRSLARSEGGLGIGLTVVHDLVALHGGQVEATSDGIGHGSEFRVTLPLAPAEPLPQKPDSSSKSGAQRVVRKVLIVDDHKDGANSLAMLLRTLKHDVRISHDGHDGLKDALAFKPDVLLLDIGLPGLTGYEVAEQLRRDPAFQSNLIIAISGYQPQDVPQNHGKFDHHLVKPVDLRHLSDLINQHSYCSS